MSSVFFNGQEYITPATLAAVDDSALSGNVPIGGQTLALLGISAGGTPNLPLIFSNPTDATATLVSGYLQQMAAKCFDPSDDTGGPSRICALRVGSPTQASYQLLDASGAASIMVVSRDYGLRSNGNRIKVEAGTLAGLKITSMLGTAYCVGDNLTRDLLSIEGPAGATVAVTPVLVTVTIGGVSTAADLTMYDTVGKLVNYLNGIVGITALVLNENDETEALNGIDAVAAGTSIAAVTTLHGNLQACIDWINSNQSKFVSALRPVGAGAAPALTPYVNLSGATEPSPTLTDWSNALQTLQSADVQIIVPLSIDPAVHAMVEAHCNFMSLQGKKPRRGIVGGDLGQSIATVKTAAALLDCDRMYECYPGVYDFDTNGALKLFQPTYLAALVGAMAAAVGPGEALTNKSVNIRGVEVTLRNPTDTDQLIPGGVLCVEDTGTDFKVVQSVSTWLDNTNFNRTELSTGTAVDEVIRTIIAALDPIRGMKGSPQKMARALDIAKKTLNALSVPEPNGPGVLVGDANSPPWKNLSASIVNDQIMIQAQVSPVIPLNFVLISLAAVPYSGTLTSS